MEETVKVTAPLVPAEVVTVRLAGPEALGSISIWKVIVVELTTVTLLTATPGLLTLTVAPGRKLAPVRVTIPLAPASPPDGLTDVSAGVPELMPKLTVPLVPPAVVTVTLADPDAFAAIANL